MKGQYLTILMSILIVTCCLSQSGDTNQSNSFTYKKQKDTLPNSQIASSQDPEFDGWTFNSDDALRVHQSYTLKEFREVNDNTKYVWMHLDEFMPTSIIVREGEVSKLKYSLMPEISQITAKTDLGILTLDEYIKKSELQGIIVVYKGKIVYERYPRMRSFDKHLYFSVTKVFSGTEIAMLEEEGKVDVSKPIGQYLPELNKSDWGKVKISDILNMTTGMTLQVGDPKALVDSNNVLFQFLSTMGIMEKTSFTTNNIWDALNKMQKLKEPGTAFDYSNTNAILLELLAQQVSGKTFAEFISEKIWKKMGAEADAYIALSPQGIATVSTTMNSTLRDLARFGMLFTPHWNVVSKEKIISDSYLNKIQHGGADPSIFDKGAMGREIIENIQEKPDHNSYQWDFVMQDGDFYKAGVRGQGLYISPAKDLVIACFSHGDHNSVAYLRSIAKSGLFP